MFPFPLSRLGLAFLFACLAVATPSAACTVSASVASNLGTYSPGAVKAAAVPALASQAGLACTPAVLVLLSNNYINAKFHSQNGLKLLQTSGSGAVAYTASADAAASAPFVQDGTVNYMQNNLLNLLGLLGGSSANFPFYVKPAGGTLPPPGIYTDRITITWTWYLCQGLSALSLCLGTADTGNAPATIDITLTVTPAGMALTMSSVTTWDPINGTTSPKALPNSRRRAVVTAMNPDIVPIDGDTVAVLLAVDPGQTIALDGDGTGATITFADGSPASTLTLRYVSPGSTADDVDFSSDGGATWSYVPIAGNAMSQAAVNRIRLRPRGAMAAGSSFTVAVPFSVN